MGSKNHRMKPQNLKVLSIEWFDIHSGQGSILFETKSGLQFTCFTDCGMFVLGENVKICDFYWIPHNEPTIEEMYESNINREKSLEQLDEWDYFVKGQIVVFEKDIAYVDCGGLIIPYDGFSCDTRTIGDWIGFRVNRLEAERCYS